jgi:hypothetical protein
MMVWLNEYDIDMLVDRFEDQTAAPHVVKGVLALDRFRDWTNRNSDGWAYWKLAAKAADKLMDRLEEAQRQYRRGGLCEDMSPQQLAALLRPVRALMRKHGVEDTDAILFPPPPPPGPVERWVYLPGDADGPDLLGIVYEDEDPAIECASENDGAVWKIKALLIPDTAEKTWEYPDDEEEGDDVEA